jgi:hypothetical protein
MAQVGPATQVLVDHAIQAREVLEEDVQQYASSKETDTHDISVQYGQGYPIKVKREWLSRAHSWRDQI